MGWPEAVGQSERGTLLHSVRITIYRHLWPWCLIIANTILQWDSSDVFLHIRYIILLGLFSEIEWRSLLNRHYYQRKSPNWALTSGRICQLSLLMAVFWQSRMPIFPSLSVSPSNHSVRHSISLCPLCLVIKFSSPDHLNLPSCVTVQTAKLSILYLLHHIYPTTTGPCTLL